MPVQHAEWIKMRCYLRQMYFEWVHWRWMLDCQRQTDEVGVGEEVAEPHRQRLDQ